jgi:hypothetical protein
VEVILMYALSPFMEWIGGKIIDYKLRKKKAMIEISVE